MTIATPRRAAVGNKLSPSLVCNAAVSSGMLWYGARFIEISTIPLDQLVVLSSAPNRNLATGYDDPGSRSVRRLDHDSYQSFSAHLTCFECIGRGSFR